MHVCYQFLIDEAGNTSMEYALILTCIALAIIGGLNSVGTELGNRFSSTTAALAR